MLRKFAAAAIMLVFGAGIALADTHRGIITEVGKDKVHIRIFSKDTKKGELPEAKAYDLAKDAEVYLVEGGGKGGKKGKETKTSVSALQDVLKDAGETKFKGVFGSIETNDDKKVTKITYRVFKKKDAE